MTDDLARLEEKIDRISDIVERLGIVIVRRADVINRAGLHKDRLNNTPGFEEQGKRKTYIEIGEIPVVKRRKRKQKTPR